LSKAKSHFPAVAQTVGFGLGKSKILYLSMGTSQIRRLLLRKILHLDDRCDRMAKMLEVFDRFRTPVPKRSIAM
jgi:hypothetical protein